jgi:hypothetical protein
VKRISLMGLAIVAVSALSGFTATSALANIRCRRVQINGTGTFQDPQCMDLLMMGNYILVTENQVSLGNGVACAEVAEEKTGTFSNSKCEGKEEKGGKYIKIFAPSPGWHFRAKGGTGEGEEIQENSPESFNGEGGEQILKGILAGDTVEITSKSVQAKGIIYNNSFQGQIKVLLIYHEPKLVTPVLKECEVKIGTNNEVKSEGHLAWKWNGTKAQLEVKPQTKEQKPDIIFTPAPIKANEKKLPEGTFTTITLKGSGCGLLASTSEVKGSQSSILTPGNVGEWSTKLITSYPGWKQQHFWDGTEFIGAEPELKFANNISTLTGSVESKSAENEIAVFE